MSLTAHLSELERRHQALDKKLSDELARPARDSAAIAAIKRQKLLLKDEMTRLRTGGKPPNSALH